MNINTIVDVSLETEQKPDPEKLLYLAAEHHVRPLFYKGLQSQGYQNMFTILQLESLRKKVFRISMKNLRLANELKIILSQCIENNIQAIPYKGIVLAYSAYGDLGSREFRDMDLLIDLRDIRKIGDLLTKRNYRPESPIQDDFFEKLTFLQNEYNYSLWEGATRIFHVEPHWALGPIYYQISFRLIDFEPFIKKIDYLGMEVDGFSPEGLLISTCLHHAGQDNWSSLKQVADVAAILIRYEKDIDWELLLRTAKAWKVKFLIAEGILLTTSLFEVVVPAAILEVLTSRKVQKSIATRITKWSMMNMDSVEPSVKMKKSFFYHLLYRETWNTKMKIVYFHVLKLILPNENDLVNVKSYTLANYLKLILYKPFRLLNKYLLGKT